MTTLSKWYNAWVTKDLKTIEELLHNDVYGCRFYNNHICYTKEEILQELQTNTITSYELSNIKDDGYTTEYELSITDSKGTYKVLCKAVFENDKLVKLFETKKTGKTRIKVVCSYDGSAFSGYQKQPNVDTVQGTIEETLEEIFNTPVLVHASGRTDKGVHALHQVFHFDVKTSIPVSKMDRLIDGRLPDSIHILSLKEVPETFHSRYDVISKEYMYKINHTSYNPIQRNYEWFVPNINLEQLKKDAKEFLGTHDFQSFTKQADKDTTRTIQDIRIEQDDTHTFIYIKGDGFLRYMVRYMVFALIKINQGTLKNTITDVLEKKDVHILGELAPASGLYLNRVLYEDVRV